MNILVAKNGSQLGPFSETDLRAKLASGEFAPTDFGWHEGLTAWAPLSQLLGSDPAPSPMAPLPTPSAPAPGAYAPQPYAAPQGQNLPGGYAPQPANSPYPAAYQPGAMPAWGAQGSSNYAGFWLRFVALIIDGIILAIPRTIVAFVLLAIGLSQGAVNLLVAVLSLLLYWFYFATMESSANQGTLGKMALGLKVTDENGNRLSFGSATGRYFGKLVSTITLGIGYIMAGFTQRKQALHDLMAHTLVVRK